MDFFSSLSKLTIEGRCPRLNQLNLWLDGQKSNYLGHQPFIRKACLTVEETSKKRTFRHGDWAIIYSLLMIYFGDRSGERA